MPSHQTSHMTLPCIALGTFVIHAKIMGMAP
jgi:hypothetical protein